MFDFISVQEVIAAVVFAGIGFVLGYIIQELVQNRIRKFTESTSNQFDDELVKVVRFYPELILTTAGLYFSTYVISTEGISATALDTTRNVFLVLIILFATSLLASAGTVLMKYYISKNRALSGNTSIFSNIVRISVYTIGILVALQSAGVDITALVATLGVGGLAVALALQDTLSNLFAGIYIIAARKIKNGDYIELDNGDKGYVEDISWRNTQIRELGDNTVIIVPNSNLSTAIVKNYYLPVRELAVIVSCGVSYDSDLEKVEKIAIEVATEIQKSVEGAVKTYEPFVRFNEFADSSINFDTIMRGNQYVDQFLVKHEFIKALHKRFKDEGIEIPFPQHVVTLNK